MMCFKLSAMQGSLGLILQGTLKCIQTGSKGVGLHIHKHTVHEIRSLWLAWKTRFASAGHWNQNYAKAAGGLNKWVKGTRVEHQ